MSDDDALRLSLAHPISVQFADADHGGWDEVSSYQRWAWPDEQGIIHVLYAYRARTNFGDNQHEDSYFDSAGNLIGTVNVDSYPGMEPDFVPSLLNPVDLLSGAAAGHLVGGGARAAASLVDGVADELGDQATTKGLGGLTRSSGVRIYRGGNGRSIGGHGLDLGDEFVVPHGTTVTFWAGNGNRLSMREGLFASHELSSVADIYRSSWESYGSYSALSGSVAPDITIFPVSAGSEEWSRTLLVDGPTRLSQLLRPNMGHMDLVVCTEAPSASSVQFFGITGFTIHR